MGNLAWLPFRAWLHDSWVTIKGQENDFVAPQFLVKVPKDSSDNVDFRKQRIDQDMVKTGGNSDSNSDGDGASMVDIDKNSNSYKSQRQRQ